MTTATLHAQLEAARAVVNAIDYNAIGWQQKWDEAMALVRALTVQIDIARAYSVAGLPDPSPRPAERHKPGTSSLPNPTMSAPTAPAYTLPTIHLNGTGAKSLATEYHEVYKATDRACQALADATCNARDFYPQGPAAYEQARKERDDAFLKLKEVQDLAEAWMARASGDI